ncbi:hypothetical protein AKJ16_DCAP05059 [Drosera capensis]
MRNHHVCMERILSSVILSAYFVVLPLRDEGALSLGISNLPGLFVGSLVLTLVAAPVSTLIFSSPTRSKARGLELMHRFFGVSLIVFFILWHFSAPGFMPMRFKGSAIATSTLGHNVDVDHTGANSSYFSGWDGHSWFYVSVRIGMFLWIALFNLITISSTWARVIDVMDSESGSRLFGFIGAGATLGQLFGSLFAAGMAWMGSTLLLVAALLMELAAQSSKGINRVPHLSEEHSPLNKPQSDEQTGGDQKTAADNQGSSPSSSAYGEKHQLWVMFDGLWLILSSTYLIYVSLFLWLSAAVSSFFYFQKVTIIAMATSSAVGRRKLFAEINSFIAVFILAGQITLTGHILTTVGVTVAICSAPLVASLNWIVIAVWPTWVVIAISETIRKVVTYVVTRPGRELLFTVVSQEEKYKAKVCIDVIVQRLGDATAAGMFRLLFGSLKGKTSTLSLYALPVCFLWMVVAFYLGKRRQQLANPPALVLCPDSQSNDMPTASQPSDS